MSPLPGLGCRVLEAAAQLAHADTLLFEFAFWPTINISKNRHRDGFLFSFHLFFFFFNPLCKTDSYLSWTPVLVISHFPFFTVAFWSQHLYKCHRGTAAVLCSLGGTDNTEFSGALAGYTCLEAAPHPCRDAFASLLDGFGVTKALPTGNSSIKGRWKKKPVEAGTDSLCAAEEVLMGSLSAAGHPGDSLPASVC